MPRQPKEPPITPLSLPKSVRTVLVFGGTFDPPHAMHTIAPLIAVNRLCPKTGWVLYIPAARSPHKSRGPRAGDAHRLAMLRLALDVPAPRSIWTDEIDRAAWLRSRGIRRPSYTIETLRRLRKVLPRSVKLRLLIGSDQVGSFHRWKEPRAIIRLAEPLILPREPRATVSSIYSALDPTFWTPRERARWCTRLAPIVPMEAASTDIRLAIPGAPAHPGRWRRKSLRGIVTPVARYIIDHNLYGFRKGPAHPAKAGAAPTRPVGDDPEAIRRFNNPYLMAARFAKALAAAASTPAPARRARKR